MFNPPNASRFFQVVWTIVDEIPPGKVSSYGQIASMIPPNEDWDAMSMKSLAARWVGTALRKTPRDLPIPWQRVINSQGKISFPAGSAQARRQRQLLESEGVRFDHRGSVDFSLVGWSGPDETFLARNGLFPPRPLGQKR